MNELIASLILAVVQGIAEWFPISSSAHLILVSKLIGYENSLMLDVALHFGTLMAVVVYFSKDITDIAREVMLLNFKSKDGKLGLMLLIAVLPAAIFGFLFRGFLESNFDNIGLMALGLGITGVMLVIASLPIPARPSGDISFKRAIFIGLAQVASLFRGISRSGSTVSTGLFLGLSMKEAVRFSFLLSIPIVLGANILLLGGEHLDSSVLAPMVLAFFVGLASIHFSFRYVLTTRKNLRWFGVYVLVLALSVGTWFLLS